MDIEGLLKLMIEKGASDLHLKVPSPPTLRIRGDLVSLEGELTGEDTQRLFEAITTPQQRDAFHSELELDFGYTLPGIARFRVNASYQRGTIALAIRLIPLQVSSIAELGLPDVCRNLSTKPRGLVLVTGPTGSGKSTTLAAMIDYVNERQRRHIITIEDPIEFVHLDKKCLIAQRELEADTKSFASAIRRALRQDPDVILIGEMRDLETIATALTAAETGHLVLSTLHTTNAAQTIDRIIDAFPSGQQAQIRLQLSMVLEGVLSMTLLRRADGRGRVAAIEILIATTAIRNLIRENKTFQIPNTMQMSTQLGMQTLDQALKSLVERRLVTLEEALAASSNPEELKRLVQGL